MTSTLMFSLILVAQCATDGPGPSCPPARVPHEMVGVVGGERVTFRGWHEPDGSRHCATDQTFRRLTEPAAVQNFGVDLKPEPPTLVHHGPVLRTNDPDFGARWDADTTAERPCPGPGPCPEPAPRPAPFPEPGPAPTPDPLTQYWPHLTLALLCGATLVLVGATATVILSPRKAV